MVLAILCVIFEFLALIIVPFCVGAFVPLRKAVTSGTSSAAIYTNSVATSTSSMATICVPIYIVFSVIAICCIIYNAIRIKKSARKGKFITGLVFSIIGTVNGLSILFFFLILPHFFS